MNLTDAYYGNESAATQTEGILHKRCEVRSVEVPRTLHKDPHTRGQTNLERVVDGTRAVDRIETAFCAHDAIDERRVSDDRAMIEERQFHVFLTKVSCTVFQRIRRHIQAIARCRRGA